MNLLLSRKYNFKVVLLMVGVAAAMVWGFTRTQKSLQFLENRNGSTVGGIPSGDGHFTHVDAKTGARVSLVDSQTIYVPPVVASKMKLQLGTAEITQESVSLPRLQGVLALDNDRLSRVYSRFSGEVVGLGASTESSLSVGTRVRKGELLAVVWSSELSEKKSGLVDALVKLEAEIELRDRLKSLFEDGAGAGRNYRDAERDVQARKVEVASLERTLRTWRVSAEDFEDIREEVRHLTNKSHPAVTTSDWARVEVRSPIDGVILEKNVTVGDIVNTDVDLFKVGDLSYLSVWAHVYEDDLPLLELLPRPLPWSIQVPSLPGAVFEGNLEKIGAIIDPTQHTALVSGRVQNESGNLRVGQFVTATVQLPLRGSELVVPSTAVVESGSQSVVFVQKEGKPSEFIRCPVTIDRRLHRTVFLQSIPGCFSAGSRVVTSGALLLESAMSELPTYREAVASQQNISHENNGEML